MGIECTYLLSDLRSAGGTVVRCCKFAQQQTYQPLVKESKPRGATGAVYQYLRIPFLAYGS